MVHTLLFCMIVLVVIITFQRIKIYNLYSEVEADERLYASQREYYETLEKGYNSTVNRLEQEISRLEHLNDRLNNKNTILENDLGNIKPEIAKFSDAISVEVQRRLFNKFLESLQGSKEVQPEMYGGC